MPHIRTTTTTTTKTKTTKTTTHRALVDAPSAVGRMRATVVASPVGALVLVADDAGLRVLDLRDEDEEIALAAAIAREGGPVERDDAWFAAHRAELEGYSRGDGGAPFTFPLAPRGTPFQRSVWQLLLAIPSGATTTYGALAERLGAPSASRAVGLANGRNPIGIVVPCHRVIGKSGALTGYAGGLHRKRWLLDHEQGRRPAPLDLDEVEQGAASAPQLALL